MEGPRKQQAPRFGHLKEGVRPIMTCIGSFDDFKGELGSIEESEDGQFGNAKNIDYSGNLDEQKKQEYKNAGKNTYVISSIDNFDKFSIELYDCTGLVVTGIDKETGKNISFLSHQDPKKFLRDKDIKSNFVADLQQRLKEMKARCKEGTIDAVIVGGNDVWHDPRSKFNYLDSIELISKEARDIISFEPAVINGPKKTGSEGDIVYYDTHKRRLYFMRPVVNSDIGSFSQKDIEGR